MIRKTKKGYVLKSKDGSRTMGTFPTKAAAEKREREIEIIKHARGKK